MALIWFEQDSSGNRYELRRAGASLRLYTNGVFHSQYNPRRPVAGSVWDLLLLPAFMLPVERLRRVLVLGVGGGAVIRQLNDFFSPELIVGVELNPVHLKLAREFFNADTGNVELLEADARLWLESYRGPKFDLIIDDLFGDSGGEPCRAVPVDSHWSRSLRRVLSDYGVLAINFDSRSGLLASAPVSDLAVRQQFATAISLTTQNYANHIGVFLNQSPDVEEFERRLTNTPGLDRRRSGCKLNFVLERLL